MAAARRGGVVRRDGPHASSDPQAFPDMDPGDVVVVTAMHGDVIGDVEGPQGVAQP
jgi:hypothetical protein